jgi:predicted ATP-dependent endonuclease of OLD family
MFMMKIDTVNTLKLLPKQIFYTADSDEFTMAVPLAAMVCCETNKSVCLLLSDSSAFCQRFV